MGRKGQNKKKKHCNSKPKKTIKSSSNQNQNNLQRSAPSTASTTVIVRPLSTEKSRIVTDLDWEELKKNVNNLDNFSEEYSEWSRSCYSVAVSFFIFCVTLIIEHPDIFFDLWYFYVFVAIALVALIIGIVLMSKGMGIKQKIAATKTSISSIINRIEKKSAEIKFDYNTLNSGISL